ncbi:MAG TPA: DUF6036 family nucleotidyltransferase [Thermoanaerobaculia bacterium]|jgi:hypothetical protein|nr:DUF6036 family nucleotidyltransferase [Thermoanaerobaculia bacterium]
MRSRIETTLGALTKAKVRYLVVGGVAVVLHGYLRTTLDLDLVLHLDQGNLEKALKVFSDLGFQPQVPVPLRSFADPKTREAWTRQKNMTVFSLWHPDFQGFAVDLFIQEPFDFDLAYNRALAVNLHGVEATVISLPDLIEMKRIAGRPQDQIDVEALLQLRGEHAK